MADREKLYELIAQVQDCGCDVTDVVEMIYVENDALVDHLIANGVTIQKWIPVTERLPEEDVLVLCIGAKGGMFLGYPRFVYKNDGFAYTRVPNARGSRHATHWMPLPEAPKGE